MKMMEFAKLSATGNDFILFDNREKKFKGDERKFFQQICQRRFSVGADGVILLEESDLADFKYRHYNSDGHSVNICGNGARAICWYAWVKGITGKKIQFESKGVIYHGFCSGDGVTIDHPNPQEIQTNMEIVKEKDFEEGGLAVVGVPHLVIFCDDVDGVDVQKSGKKYRTHPFFEQGTNVNFVQIIDAQTLRMRSYERGIEAETLSCGTGAMASALILNITKGVQNPVKIRTRGGRLKVDWEKGFKPLYLSGKAELVFEGRFREK